METPPPPPSRTGCRRLTLFPPPPPHRTGCSRLRQLIYTSVEADFPRSEEAWDLRARRHSGRAASSSMPTHAGLAGADGLELGGGEADAEALMEAKAGSRMGGEVTYAPQQYEQCMQVRGGQGGGTGTKVTGEEGGGMLSRSNLVM